MPKAHTTVSLSDRKIPGFLTWIGFQEERKIKSLASIQHLGATDTEKWIQRKLIELIDSARQKIFLSSFIVAYPKVETALMKASERLRGHIYVLSPLDKSIFKDEHNSSRLSDEERQMLFENQEQRIKELSQAGIYIREHPHCHAKFCVVDRNKALIMTSNLTERSMEQNPEIGFVVTEKTDVIQLDKIFQIAWTRGASRESIPNKIRPLIQTIPPTAEKPDTLSFHPQGNLIWTYHDQQFLLKEIVRLIRQAKTNLRIGSYLIRELHNAKKSDVAEIMMSLKAALSQGVTLEIVVHAPPHRMRGSNLRETERKTLQELLTVPGVNSITIYGHPTIHAKYIIKDDDEAMFFTANIDGIFGLDNGIEVGYRFTTTREVAWLTQYHHKLVGESELALSYEPVLSQLLDNHDTQPLYVKTIVVETDEEKKSTRVDEQIEETNSGPLHMVDI